MEDAEEISTLMDIASGERRFIDRHGIYWVKRGGDEPTPFKPTRSDLCSLAMIELTRAFADISRRYRLTGAEEVQLLTMQAASMSNAIVAGERRGGA